MTEQPELQNNNDVCSKMAELTQGAETEEVANTVRDDTTDTDGKADTATEEEAEPVNDNEHIGVSEEHVDASGPTLTDVIERLDLLSEQFKLRISRSEYEDQVLKRYSDEIHEYKADLYKKITLPLLKEIIGVRDAARAIVDRAKNDGVEMVPLGSLEFISGMLETALDNHGVVVREPQIGLVPEKGVERPVGRIQTVSQEKHGTIAAIMNDAYLMDDKCIAPAKVKVFAYDESLEEQSKPEQNSLDQTVADSADGFSDEPESQPMVAVTFDPNEIPPAPVYKPE